MCKNKLSGIKMIYRSNREEVKRSKFPSFLTIDKLEEVKSFHKTMNNYKKTPLVNLNSLAKELGLRSILVKDESKRGGLNSFKVLGSSYAIAKLICKRLNLRLKDVNFNYLKSEEVKNKTGEITFVTCSDGNHGRGVAWTAREIGQKAVVYLPKGTARRRVEAIIELGAKAIVTDLNYDDTVRYAVKIAQENNWEIVQDTAWEGYTEIPIWIMQGYAAMAYEALEQIEEMGIKKPTHMFIQAGVGAMAGAVLGFCVNYFNGKHPITTVIEPVNAACMFRSAEINDGKPHGVIGGLETIMAGLACGEPILYGWEILRDFSDAFSMCPDYVTARGMRILANPLENDEKVISGESGAVGTGFISLIMQRKELTEIKEKLALNQNSTVILFSTEGATDPVNYRSVVWDGKYNIPY
ncbi:PLP-dependent lyase/thiolase [Clostridium polyendosporum]|uniref:PLP-dependent lyase/thiolase n=1 Tax=Clostridium polyendosporum TaxID=69208 RepID=A0A919RZV6_9CLOT|nr:diaminopropionate ammonia-lyase [Clostridium polyendosporum]GIM29257.1 PLP-dependent lyase/thiolase [Clostridium polyendosporum]